MRIFAFFLAVFLFSTGLAAGQDTNPDTNGDFPNLSKPKNLLKPENKGDGTSSKTNDANVASKKAVKKFELAADLDGLFKQLKRVRDKKKARRISERIWELWGESESRSIDLLTAWAQGAMQKQQFSAALDLLDQVIVLKPKYAEGWNRRATLHFMMKNYGKSIADIEQTLALEPRHYGALAGLASIQQTIGQKRAALGTWYRALEIYPAMKSAQDAVIKLEEELAGNSL